MKELIVYLVSIGLIIGFLVFLVPGASGVPWPDVSGLPQYVTGLFKPERFAIGYGIPNEVAIRADVLWSAGVIQVHVAAAGNFRISIVSQWPFQASFRGYGMEVPGYIFYGRTFSYWHRGGEAAMFISLYYDAQIPPGYVSAFFSTTVWYDGHVIQIWF